MQSQKRSKMAWATTSDQLEIYYEDSGGNLPLIVFQSGFMGIHNIWKYQVDALKSRYRCITHDNRGHGLSSSPADMAYYTTENNADDLKAVLDDAGVSEPVILCTHSMGSTNGIAFALRYPQLVKGILMMGGASISGEPKLRRGGHQEMFSVHHTSPSASMKFYVRLGLRADIAIEAGKWSRHVFRNQTASQLSFLPGEAVSRITIPVLVLHGTHDVVTPLEVVREAVDGLPNARLQIIEGVNHFPQTERPEAVNRIIEEFAKEVG